jgi:hypothetical protein
VCSDSEASRDEQSIRNYFPAVRRSILGERPKIISENAPVDAKNTEANLNGEIELTLSFRIPCQLAEINARYEWRVSYSMNGTPSKPKTVPRKKTFRCGKLFGTWVCR